MTRELGQLVDQTEPCLGIDDDFTVVNIRAGFKARLITNQVHQCSLTGAVFADNADFFALINLKINIPK